MKIRISFALALLFSSGLSLSGQVLHLKTGIKEIAIQSFAEAEYLAQRVQEKSPEYSFVILTFNSLPSIATRPRVEQYFELLNYLPDASYYARILTFPSESEYAQFKVRGITELTPNLKIASELESPDLTPWAYEGGFFKGRVYCLGAGLLDDYLVRLEQLGIEVSLKDDLTQALEIITTPDNINAIANLPFVYWIEPISPPVETNNLVERTSHRVPMVDFHNPARNLTGQNVKVGEWDGTGASEHIDYDYRHNRMEPFINNGNGQHATHVAGTVLGAGVKNPDALGMAPEALLYSWDFAGNVGLEMDLGAANQGIEITQNSYGYGATYDVCTRRGEYDGNSVALDQLVVKYPYLLHVFAAGNSRSSNCLPGGYGTVNSGYQSAKNTLVVGALTRIDGDSWFHGYGPIKDGRLKPEVCAVGVDVYSTFPINDYRGGYNGTSMACPGTAGTAALIYEWYKENRNQRPPAHLIKGVMSNGADEIGRPGPDYQFGYGRINAERTITILERNQFRIDSVSQGTVFSDTFSVSSVASELKVMLNWDDLPGSPSAAKMLVNDLDLLLIIPNGDTIKPWVLNPSLFTNNAERKVDTLNNTEQVTLANAPSGLYRILVLGRVITNARQVFSVNWLVQDTALTIVYPNGNETWVPPSSALKAQIIRWDAYGLVGNAKLEYSVDSGQTWQTIINSVNVRNLQYNWANCPDNVRTAKALIRISIGSVSDSSDRVFSIFPQMESPTAILCDSQVHLKWSALPDAHFYRVWMHKQGAMVPIDTTSKVYFTVRGLSNDSTYWFAVSAVGIDGAEGKRSWGVPFVPNNIKLPPRFISEPRDTHLCFNSDLRLKVACSGNGPINYSWQHSSDQGNTWANEGVFSDSLWLIGIPTAFNKRQFRVMAKNECESEEFSVPTQILVDTLIHFSYSDTLIALCIGQDTSLQVMFVSDNLPKAQWYFQNGMAATKTSITGADSFLLSLENNGLTNRGYYSANLINQCGVFQNPNPVFLHVRDQLTANLFGDTVVCPGNSSTINIVATGGDSLNYSVYWDTAKIAGTMLYTFPHGQSAWVSVLLEDNCSLEPVGDSLFIRSIPSITYTLPNDTLLCYGQSTAIPLQVHACDFGSLAINWQGAVPVNDSLIVSDPLNPANYIVLISDQCSSISDTVAVSMRPKLSLVNETDTTVCTAERVYKNLEASGGINTAYQFNWSDGFNGIDRNWIPANSQRYTVVLSDGCSLPDSVVFDVWVRDPLTVNLGSNRTVCQGENYILKATASGGVPFTYDFFWNGVKRIDSAQFTAINPQWVVVRLSDRCSPDAFDSVYVNTQKPLIPGLILSDDLICYNQVLDVALSTPVHGQSWITSDGKSFNTPSWQASWNTPVSISITLRIEDADGCKADTVFVDAFTVVPAATATYTINALEFRVNEDPLVMNATDTRAINWEWEISDGTTFTDPSFRHVFTDTGNYDIRLRVEDIAGCSAMASRSVYVFENPEVYLPSSFTPNKDGINDQYQPGITNIRNAEWRIYDRWGALVYECKNNNNCGWNGETLNGMEVPAGVYIVVFKGISGQNEQVIKNGSILVIR